MADRQDIEDIVKSQNKFFQSGGTRDIEFRREMLTRLEGEIRRSSGLIEAALKEDLGKSSFESYMAEIGMVFSEIDHMKKNLHRYMKNRRVKTPLAQFPARSFISPTPYGTVLIMSPWNYPFLLTMGPLVDAIAAGNTAVVKPSNYSAATSEVIKSLLSRCFEEKYVCTLTGGRDVNGALLDQRFDYIFFTGGKTVGRLVLEKAAANLTPVTLELGGKSPCIVEKSANIPLAARRIVFGKFLNAGQTCIAPDYVLVHTEVKGRLIRELSREIKKQFGENPLENPNYGKIINENHFNRLVSLMGQGDAVIGGHSDGNRKISPTILEHVSLDDTIMTEEIFGPILPIIEFSSREEAKNVIERNPTPLALYLFTDDKNGERYFLDNVIFGGGCINDTVIHIATDKMGFGGVGTSGMGSYHGKSGFDTFTHHRSVVRKGTWLDIPMRYQPYTEKNKKIVKKIMG